MLDILQGQTEKADPTFKTAEITSIITASILGFVHNCCKVDVYGYSLTFRNYWCLPWLHKCVRVVRDPGEALVLQALGDQRGGDKLTAVVVVLLLA